MKILFLALFVFLVQIGFSQSITIPPSPTVASLGNMISDPVSLFTGKSQIVIPLHTVEESTFKIPLSLSYMSNGIKVEEIAGWTGMGWNLSGIGMITRTVGYYPDDCNGLTEGYLRGDVSTVVDGFDPGASEQVRSYYIWDNFLYKSYDPEPDVFYFSFGNKSGRFVFDKNKQPRLIPYEYLDIQYTLSPLGYLQEFKITDDDGSVYLFNIRENTSLYSKDYVNTPGDHPFGGGITQNTLYYTSTWFLSSITDQRGGKIDFSYSDETYSYDNRIVNKAINCSDDNCTGGNLAITYATTISGKRLSAIEGNTFKVQLDADHARQDLPGSYALTALKVYSKTQDGNKLIKNLVLNYDYYLSSGGTGVNFKRLRLLGLKEISGVDQIPLHSFSYNSISLPQRFSFQLDLWGYYNSNNATTLIPKTYVYPSYLGPKKYRIYPKSGYAGTTYILPGADRLPNVSYMQAGILQEITYPTGGKLILEYEPHQFVYDSEVLTGGGLRIKKTTHVPSTTSTEGNIVKNYSYTFSSTGTCSGKAIMMPFYCFIENGLHECYYNPDDYSGYEYFNRFLVRSSVSVASQAMTYGSFIGYKEVKTEITGSGKSIFRYSLPGSIEEANDCDLAGIGSCQCNINDQGFCDELYVPGSPFYVRDPGDLTNYTYDTPKLQEIDFFQGTFPFAPLPIYDWNRGHIIYQKDFDNNGLLLKEVNYKYKLFTKESAATIVYGLRIGFLQNCNLNDLQFYQKYKIATDIKKVIESVEEKSYSLNDQSTFVSNKTLYKYETLLLDKITSEHKINSDGSEIITRYKYPAGYLPKGSPDATTAVIFSMDFKHMNNAPLESVTYIKKAGSSVEQAIKGSLKLFQIKDDYILPYQEWTLEIKKPASDFIMSTITAQAQFRFLFKDARYQLKHTYTQFDSRYNVIEELDYRNIYCSYKWGYKYSLPIAQVFNANQTQISHLNFEDLSDNDNWEVQGGSRADKTADPLLVYSGNYSYKVNPGSPSWGPTRNLTPSIQKGKYKFSCWIKTEAGFGFNNGTMYIYATDANNCCSWYPANQTPGSKYISDTNGDWIYYEVILDMDQTRLVGNIPSTTNLTLRCFVANDNVTKSFYVDDLRICPVDAEMTTYTYDPLIGTTSISDLNNKITFYEYDGYRRLTLEKDFSKSIIKRYKYQYKAQ